MLQLGFLEARGMTQGPTLLPPRDPLNRDPLAVIAVSAAPILLEGRYRVLV